MSLTDVKKVWRDNFGEPIDFHDLGVTRSKITVPAGMQLAAKNWYRSAVQLSECPCQLRGQLPKHHQTATLRICIRRAGKLYRARSPLRRSQILQALQHSVYSIKDTLAADTHADVVVATE